MLQGSLEETREMLSTDISWGWDARFHTALMVVQPENSAAILVNQLEAEQDLKLDPVQ